MSEDIRDLKHPKEPIFIHIEYRSGTSHTILRGRYELRKLVALAQFMVECIDKLVPSQEAPAAIVVQEGSNPVEDVPVPVVVLQKGEEPKQEQEESGPSPSEREKKWREFRETIVTTQAHADGEIGKDQL